MVESQLKISDEKDLSLWRTALMAIAFVLVSILLKLLKIDLSEDY